VLGWIKKIKEIFREKRKLKNEAILDAIKMAYHTFRILQTKNDQALDAMNDLDLKFRTSSHGVLKSASGIKELLDNTFELVDGLCHLDASKTRGLFERYNLLAGKINNIVKNLPQNDNEQPYCLFLNKITPELKDNIGGKAASLVDLKKAGLPIPDGFVISIHACQQFLKENGLDQMIMQRLGKLEGVDIQQAEIENVASEITAEILQTPLQEDLVSVLKPAYERLSACSKIGIAVRSSARVEDQINHSFAGQFESVLNVTHWDHFVLSFKTVLASNFNARCISYRIQLGLPLVDFDMAVVCLVMIKAKTAGVLFTVAPGEAESDRMLISAVAGLGISAVGGEVPTDLYYPSRKGDQTKDLAKIGAKTSMVVCSAEGGTETRTLNDTEKMTPLLNPDQRKALADVGLIIESLNGQPQDIEWGIDDKEKIWILQARPLILPSQPNHKMASLTGNLLINGGVIACPGRAVGRVKIIRSMSSFLELKNEPKIMVLHQSLVDAARWIPTFEGVIVDLGNPADHLSCIAREYGRPMLTGIEGATEELRDGQLVVLDADGKRVLEAPESIWPEVKMLWETAKKESARLSESETQPSDTPSEIDQLQSLIFQLNLTDAYGPTFSIQECQSIHDLIRYVHEMAILSMFNAGDELLFGGGYYYRLESSIPFFFQIIDLGGGVTPSQKTKKISLTDISSTPFLAMWDGISTPGIRWSGTPPNANFSGLISKSMLDQRSARPVGGMNYVLLAYDYLNLNARMDYHFVMVDAVCGSNYRDNYIRFRFKGGGTSQLQRERRTKFIDRVLRENDFYTYVNGDLITGTLIGLVKETTRNRLVMIGRLLGFSRLMDAAMTDDNAPDRLAQAFFDGDYNLEQFSKNDRK
jgi:pyruvate, water dikinase